MTHLLLLDTEQAAILVDAAETSVRLLNYRLQRADPDGVISASVRLQERKIAQVKRQLSLPPIPAWDEMTEARRAGIVNMAKLIANNDDTSVRAVAFEKLFAEVAGGREEHAERTAELDGDQAPVEDVPAPKNEGRRVRKHTTLSEMPQGEGG